MKVEIERATSTGERSVRVVANDCIKAPATLRHWIRMLQLAERWLREGYLPKPQEAKKK
jgi:hypothetical protein